MHPPIHLHTILFSVDNYSYLTDIFRIGHFYISPYKVVDSVWFCMGCGSSPFYNPINLIVVGLFPSPLLFAAAQC